MWFFVVFQCPNAQNPTLAPTHAAYSSAYCRQYGGVNTTNADTFEDCTVCVAMGCAYCQVSDDDPRRNYLPNDFVDSCYINVTSC